METKEIELALISEATSGISYWSIVKDGNEIFTSPDFWRAHDKFDEIVSEDAE